MPMIQRERDRERQRTAGQRGRGKRHVAHQRPRRQREQRDEPRSLRDAEHFGAGERIAHDALHRDAAHGQQRAREERAQQPRHAQVDQHPRERIVARQRGQPARGRQPLGAGRYADEQREPAGRDEQHGAQRPAEPFEPADHARRAAAGRAFGLRMQHARPRGAAPDHREHQRRADERDRDTCRQRRVEARREHRAVGDQHERTARERRQRHQHAEPRGAGPAHLAQQVRRDEPDIRQRARDADRDARERDRDDRRGEPRRIDTHAGRGRRLVAERERIQRPDHERQRKQRHDEPARGERSPVAPG